MRGLDQFIRDSLHHAGRILRGHCILDVRQGMQLSWVMWTDTFPSGGANKAESSKILRSLLAIHMLQ